MLRFKLLISEKQPSDQWFMPIFSTTCYLYVTRCTMNINNHVPRAGWVSHSAAQIAVNWKQAKHFIASVEPLPNTCKSFIHKPFSAGRTILQPSETVTGTVNILSKFFKIFRLVATMLCIISNHETVTDWCSSLIFALIQMTFN